MYYNRKQLLKLWSGYMKGYVIDYINENEFKKLERALKKYDLLAYKNIHK